MTVKSKPLKNPKIICFCCKGVGHKANNCCSKRKIIKKKIWVPKGTKPANPKGTKVAWVPKSIP